MERRLLEMFLGFLLTFSCFNSWANRFAIEIWRNFWGFTTLIFHLRIFLMLGSEKQLSSWYDSIFYQFDMFSLYNIHDKKWGAYNLLSHILWFHGEFADGFFKIISCEIIHNNLWSFLVHLMDKICISFPKPFDQIFQFICIHILNSIQKLQFLKIGDSFILQKNVVVPVWLIFYLLVRFFHHMQIYFVE